MIAGGHAEAAVRARRLPVRSLPIERSHPEAMAVVAILFGLSSPEPSTARILELGCADGANLVPLAALLPRARLVGTDTRSDLLGEARAFAERVGAGNVSFVNQGLESMPGVAGSFDYIICHEPLSALPMHVQQLVLQTVKTRLGAKGVAYLSYRCRRAPRSDSGPNERGLGFVDAGLHFADLAGRLERSGLQYLGEADFTTMLPSNLDGKAEQIIQRIARRGLVAAEQAMDYLRRRSYRETLVCHAGISLKRRIEVKDIDALHLSAVTSEYRSKTPGGAARYQASNGAYLTTSHPALQAVMRTLNATYPSRATLRQLLSAAGPIREADRARLAYSVFTACMSGVVDLSVGPLPGRSTSVNPVAWSVARDQAARQHWVSNLQHRLVSLGDFPLHRRAVEILDGSLDTNHLAQVLASGSDAASLLSSANEQEASNPSEAHACLAAAAPQLLQDLRRLALIEDGPARRG